LRPAPDHEEHFVTTPPNYEDLPRSVEDCTSYSSGHRLHYIQGTRSSGQRADCRIRHIEPDGWVTVELLEDDLDETADGSVVYRAGSVVRCWVHDPVFLQAQLEHFGTANNKISHKWRYLAVANWYPQSFSLAPSPCVTVDPAGDPVKDLQTHGGFVLSGQQALAWLSEHQKDELDADSELTSDD
jgi:hypothetical protein